MMVGVGLEVRGRGLGISDRLGVEHERLGVGKGCYRVDWGVLWGFVGVQRGVPRSVLGMAMEEGKAPW